MYLDEQLPPLRGEGFCPECNAWIDLDMDEWFPMHTQNGTNVECPNLNYAPAERRFVIENRAEAEQVRKFLLAQKGHCLFSYGLHSASCRDGRRCEHLTRLYYQALARFDSSRKETFANYRCEPPTLSTEGRCSHCSEWYLLSSEKSTEPSLLSTPCCKHDLYPVKETRYVIQTADEAFDVSTFLTNRHGNCEARKHGETSSVQSDTACCSEFLRYTDALARFVLARSDQIQKVVCTN